MLLEFAIQNYKSFADEAVLSLEPAPKQKGLDYSVHAEKVGGRIVKGLSCAVIYGPNASGKTTLIAPPDSCRSSPTRQRRSPGPCGSESSSPSKEPCTNMSWKPTWGPSGTTRTKGPS